ncbi:hypothetical protein [Larkinella sp. C7]|uniref:hypothetical protein n=1 Tax=Larkinella sp. C7 TaxID=2576607 RepID=UPI00111155B7|nr:hypothetical protein [Larkinella sp. C7]
MKKENIIQDKNGLRNYGFEKVQKNKRIHNYDPDYGTSSYTIKGMFYRKKCQYCEKDFEARRVDTAFCCQGCQKAHLRLRKKGH